MTLSVRLPAVRRPLSKTEQTDEGQHLRGQHLRVLLKTEQTDEAQHLRADEI